MTGEQGLEQVILKAVSAPIIATDAAGAIVYANTAAERLWGYASGELTGLAFHSLLTPPHRFDLSKVPGEASDAEPASMTVEAEGLRPDASTFALELRLQVAAGAPRRLVIAAHDVSQRRAVERDLWRAVDTAEAAARQKGDMLATLSHEVRNPLGAILGWLEFLLETQLDENQHRLCSAIDRNANVLMSLLNDILDYSKGEARKLKLDSVTFDLRALLAEATELFSETAAQKGIEMRCEVDPRVSARVEGDPRRLRQILINLVGNAVKFTERGSVTIRVMPDDGQARYRFEIADTGIGIDPDALPHLFEAFTPAANATARRFGGTGLGLAICRQLAELMGGEIGVDSSTGRGSTFWLSLRLGSPLRKDVTPRPAATSRLPLRVLIADDSAANQLVATEFVEKLGHTADSVANGLEVLEAVKSRRYDVILMDIWMPELDGLAAAQRLAESCPPERRPRVIAVTSDATPETRTRCALVGMVDYVTKPLSLERLEQALARSAASSVDAADGS